MRHSNRRSRIDPDPFSVAVGIAGILGGVVGAVDLYTKHFGLSPRRTHRSAITALAKIVSNLESLSEHLSNLDSVTSRSIQTNEESTLGRSVALSRADFREYAKLTDGIMQILRALLKSTHHLERGVAYLPYVSPSASREIVRVQLVIEQLLKSRNQPVVETLAILREVAELTAQMASRLLAELHGGTMLPGPP